jgi:hypothetical protein
MEHELLNPKIFVLLEHELLIFTGKRVSEG